MDTKTYEDDLTYRIIGAAFEVHNELGNGFLEAVYQEALQKEFAIRGINFIRHPRLLIYYKGEKLNKEYEADFICEDRIIVELKAEKKLVTEDVAQILNYLKATGYQKGILLNFGSTRLEHRSYVF